MNISPFPIYNTVLGNIRRVLIEKKNKKDSNVISNYLFEFYGSDGITKLIINSPHHHFIIDDKLESAFKSNEYLAFKIQVVENVGETDGSEFIKWINSFNIINPYQYNIYSENARDISIYPIDENGNNLQRFMLSGCTIKRAMFYRLNRANKNFIQISIDLCARQGLIS